MKLISSADTLNFLCGSAPRPWVKRMLCWMIHQNELTPVFRRGKIVPYTHASSLIYDIPNIHSVDGKHGRDEAIRKHYEQPLADIIIAAESHDNIYDEPVEWGEEDEPHEISAGFFDFASDIDWEKGDLEADLDNSMVQIEYMFWNDEYHFQSNFDKPSFDIHLYSLCFDRDVIEMLLPQSSAIQDNSIATNFVVKQRGRPQKWDWEGAIAHVVGLAQHPDGLATGSGAQAEIEREISEWFVAETGNSPAISQIRVRAQTIMRKIARPEKAF